MVWTNQATDRLVFPPGATTGARIVIDSNGIIIYDNANNIVWSATPGAIVPAGSQDDYAILNGGIDSLGLNRPSIRWGNGFGAALETIVADDGNGQTELLLHSVGGGPLRYFFGAIQQILGPAIAPSVTFTFGAGLEGGYYYEEMNITVATVVATGALTTIKYNNYTHTGSDKTFGGYDNTTGIFTAPYDGYYHFSGYLRQVAIPGVVINRAQVRVQGSGGPFSFDSRPLTAAAQFALSFSTRAYMTAGQTATISVFQDSGGNINIDEGRLSIHRAL